jgi:class 3 adenylate cyclase
METPSVYIPMDRRLALARGASLPDRTHGAALFADISGFTPLTEALVRELGKQRGAEELTRHLNIVYDALIGELHSYGGCVIGFSGDAITCWLDGDDGSRATTCALAMQQAMRRFATVTIPSGAKVSLAMKAAVAAGPARRFLVGDPSIQTIDALAGAILDHLAAAEHHAQKGEVTLDPAALAALEGNAQIAEWRADEETDQRFGVVNGLARPANPLPWPPLAPDALDEDVVRPWLLPVVYERLRSGQGEFLAELRPAVVLFLRFGGIDYDEDETAGARLDTYVREVQKVCAKYEGTLLQLTIGDKGSYMYAAFGAPLAHEDDAVRAVSAALDLQALTPRLDYLTATQIGISQGRMRTGDYGGNNRRTYGVLGDDVNLAARLMQAAAPGQILVSKVARQAAGEAFNWESLPDMRVKGKAEPVTVFSLAGLKERHAIRLQEPKYALPMVGREAELALIEQKIELALQERGQIVGSTPRRAWANRGSWPR